MQTVLDQQQLELHLNSVRLLIESGAKGKADPGSLFREYFVADDGDGEMPMLEAQMKDLMDLCNDFPAVLTAKLDHGYRALSSHYCNQLFSYESAVKKAAVGAGSPSAHRKAWPVAKMLPVTKRAPDFLFKPSMVRDQNSIPEVAEFFCLIYTSMEAADNSN